MTTTVQAERVVNALAAGAARRGRARPAGRARDAERAFDAAGVDDGDRVVELAPGLGLTTDAILARDPRAWAGVEPGSARRRAPGQGVRRRRARGGPTPVDATGLGDESATLVVTDALLGTLDAPGRAAVLDEAAPPAARAGGASCSTSSRRRPDAARDTEAADDLASIGIHPLTERGWREAAEAAGLVVVGSLVGAVAMPPQRDLMRRAGPRTALQDHAPGRPRRRPAHGGHPLAGDLERRALALRSIVVVAEMPLILGMRRPRR